MKEGANMKKILSLSIMLVVFAASTTWAALITMNFDEAFVTGGTIGNRQDGTQVSTQYAISPYGVTWADIYPGADAPPIYYTGQVVCIPGEFAGTGWNTGNSLFIYGSALSGSTGSPYTATVTLSTPSNYFSMDYRRPQAAGSIDFALYLGASKVSDSGSLAWANGDGWKTFTSPSVKFDKVVILESDKFNVDNFKINTVPIPSAIFLFAPGLAALVGLRKRINK
jgi:hypothetical protein